MLHEIFIGNVWFGWFMWILIISLVLILIWNNTHEKDKFIPFEKNESALEILKKRYANGEITKDQFEQMKKDVS